MIEYCKEEKLRLVLVIPPMHRSLCRKFPSVAKEQLIDSFITEANGGGDMVLRLYGRAWIFG